MNGYEEIMLIQLLIKCENEGNIINEQTSKVFNNFTKCNSLLQSFTIFTLLNSGFYHM